MSIEDYMIPCLSKKIFGFDCLGCGLQRSLLFLSKGEFIDAFKMYPAIYTLLPLAILLFMQYFMKTKQFTKSINSLALVSVATIIINYIIKITL